MTPEALFEALELCAAQRRPAERPALAAIAALGDTHREDLLRAALRMRRSRSGVDVNMEGIVSAKTAAAIAGGAGIFVTALGAGVGIRYLTNVGLTWTTALGHIRAGSVTPLAVTSARRLKEFPDVPTLNARQRHGCT